MGEKMGENLCVDIGSRASPLDIAGKMKSYSEWVVSCRVIVLYSSQR